jgi:hypothetical protein
MILYYQVVDYKNFDIVLFLNNVHMYEVKHYEQFPKENKKLNVKIKTNSY